MKTGQKIVAALLGLILAMGTFFYLEASGYSADITHYFFGDSTDLKSLSTSSGTHYWQRLKAIMLLLAIFFILYCFVFLLFFEALALLYFLFSSKWRKPRVFISYKNSAPDAAVNTTEIAEAIKNQLGQHGFRTLFFTYTKALHHDEVNFRIQENIRKAHAMVVVPDPQHPSYVNTEIQGAVLAYKPVYLVKFSEDQKLPDTANSGHSVLLWHKLKESKCTALNQLLCYVHQYWTTRFFILGIPLISFFIPFVWIDENDHSFKALILFALLVAGLIYINVPLQGLQLFIECITILIATVGAYTTILAIFERSHLQQAARQSVLSGGSAYQAFKEAGIDKAILDCLDEDGLVILPAV
ncbi:MAG TPA: TIR domain-containing protein [Chitinophagaceae bacterium]|nr:TIR domain-containing protein [Chitinophagaceae bacterium]